LLEYDDVANDQRKVIYEQRTDLMSTDDISENIQAIRHDVIEALISSYIAPNSMEEQWDVEGLTAEFKQDFEADMPIQQWLDEEHDLHEESLRARIQGNIQDIMASKQQVITESMMRTLEKDIMLQMLDAKWKEHLAAMDYLRQSVNLRGFAQKNPKQEYKREAFEMFQQMLEDIKRDTIIFLCRVQLKNPDAVEANLIDQNAQSEAQADAIQMQHAQADSILQSSDEAAMPPPRGNLAQANSSAGAGLAPITRSGKKVGRNDPCICGSGKKYKQCCGKIS
jgi:preprotein translocase subunit SecA